MCIETLAFKLPTRLSVRVGEGGTSKREDLYSKERYPAASSDKGQIQM